MEENSAAIKLINNKKPTIKDGDGDGGEIIEVIEIIISAVSNGWVVNTTYDNGDEVTEVFDTDGKDDGNRQTIECVLDSMGVSQEIKLK